MACAGTPAASERCPVSTHRIEPVTSWVRFRFLTSEATRTEPLAVRGRAVSTSGLLTSCRRDRRTGAISRSPPTKCPRHDWERVHCRFMSSPPLGNGGEAQGGAPNGLRMTVGRACRRGPTCTTTHSQAWASTAVRGRCWQMVGGRGAGWRRSRPTSGVEAISGCGERQSARERPSRRSAQGRAQLPDSQVDRVGDDHDGCPRHTAGTTGGMDPFEPIRRGYHALGLGADADVRAMLDQSGPEPAC
jgi:hypothetical protein